MAGLDPAIHLKNQSARGRVSDHRESMTVSPEDAGLPRWPLDAVKGGEAKHNASALTRLLDGERGAIATSCFSTPPPR